MTDLERLQRRVMELEDAVRFLASVLRSEMVRTTNRPRIIGVRSLSQEGFPLKVHLPRGYRAGEQ